MSLVLREDHYSSKYSYVWCCYSYSQSSDSISPLNGIPRAEPCSEEEGLTSPVVIASVCISLHAPIPGRGVGRVVFLLALPASGLVAAGETAVGGHFLKKCCCVACDSWDHHHDEVNRVLCYVTAKMPQTAFYRCCMQQLYEASTTDRSTMEKQQTTTYINVL